MASGEDWVMRPVLRRMCGYEALLRGEVRLIDIAKMNEALDVEAENRRRIAAAQPQR